MDDATIRVDADRQPPLLVLLCGRSFSGKSILAREVAEHSGSELISYDSLNEVRGLQGGEGIPVEEWARTNAAAHELARVALKEQRGVVVDDTSSPRFLRDQWRTVTQQAGAKFVLLYMNTDVDTIQERHRANRKSETRHDVSDKVFAQHLKEFEPPSSDEAFVSVTSPVDIDATMHLIFELANRK